MVQPENTARPDYLGQALATTSSLLTTLKTMAENENRPLMRAGIVFAGNQIRKLINGLIPDRKT